MAMKRLFGKLIGDVRGATAVEYGLILALVVLAMIGALLAFASTSVGIWNNVSTQVRDAR
jgi:pilus assembly protein Flp/PilA